MRGAFVRTITEMAASDPRIALLTGDLGFMALEPFAERFPERFFNAGVAEQNMIGMATGLAEAGFVPFAYSIVTFATLRPYEFIRNGAILHQLPVRIVGIGGGFEYGPAGPSHFGLEDVGVMRIQPGMTVIAPADAMQTRTALLATHHIPGPIYYRLGKDDKTIVPGLEGRFEHGRAQIIREGTDLLLITMGSIAVEAVAAAEELAIRGIEATVMVVATLNPAPVEDIAEVMARFPVALCVEAHYAVGGVGSLVAEVIAEQGIHSRIIRCAVKQTPSGLSGSQDYLYRINGLSRESLVETALHALEKVTM
jgi:transketolase